MSAEDLEKYETEMELQLYREYKDIVRQFSYVVETERRFYLANEVELTRHGDEADRGREAVRQGRDIDGAARRLLAALLPLASLSKVQRRVSWPLRQSQATNTARV